MLKELQFKYSNKKTIKKLEADIKQRLSQCDILPLTKGQERDIQAYYTKMLGCRIPTYWHQYHYSRNGFFSTKYVPSSEYHINMVYRLNYYDFRMAYVDKAIYDVFFRDINRPKTIVKNVNGYFSDGEKAITREDAIERCRNLGGAVVKPTLVGMRGQGVRLFSTIEGKMSDGDTVDQLFSSYKVNFIIQERAMQHEEMARLNPTSLNTIRVLTYRDTRQVYPMYAIARIGRMGQMVDNLSAGGLFADIDLCSGKIRERGFSSPKENHIMKTDSGVLLDGFQIPSFGKVISMAKELHTRLPYFNLIGWDFGVDEKGEPLLIEWNRNPDIFSQTAHGPAFGDMTDEILTRVRTLPDTRLVRYV